MEEGERFTFAPASVETSLRGADTAKLQDLVAVKPGGAYSQDAIEKSVEKMTLALSDQGLAFAQVKPTPKRDNAGRTIAIAFRVEEGPRIFVERIDIVGNKKTKDFVIRREFRVAEGDAVNAFMIERGRKRVQALGFFKSRHAQEAAGLGAGQGGDRHRCGRGPDDRFRYRRRLLDVRRAWSATSRLPTATCSATARRCA